MIRTPLDSKPGLKSLKIRAASITTLTFFTGHAYSLTLGLLVSPLILTTVFIRHYLRRHNFNELISGVLVGMLVVLGLIGLGFL